MVGIPMGCDCAPQVADLFLYCMSITKSQRLSIQKTI